MDKERIPYDQSYKMLFSEPEMVSSLFQDFVPETFISGIDFTTLEKVAGSYVTDDCRERHDDIVWRVKCNEEWVYLYLIVEFQSTVDSLMAVRITNYTTSLWLDLYSNGKINAGRKLSPIFPLVLYNGSKKWTAAQDIADLQYPMTGPLAAYQPHQKYFLLEESQVTEERLAQAEGVAAFLLRLERAREPENLRSILAEMNKRLRGPRYQRLRRVFTIWLTRVALRRSNMIGDETEFTDLQEVESMLAERAPLWKQEYIQQGIQQGMTVGHQKGLSEGITVGESRGLAMALQDYLETRFGDLSQDLRSRIVSNSDAQSLRELTRSAYRAESLERFMDELKKAMY